MDRNCDVCRVPYVAKRPNSRFCSERCRKRAQRGSPTVAAVIVAPSPRLFGSLTSVTTAELERAGRLDTTAGVAALILAARLDAETTDTGSSVAALVREHRVTLTEALRGAALADPVDELRNRRDARRAG